MKGIALAVIASGLLCLAQDFPEYETTEETAYDIPLQGSEEVCDAAACSKNCKEYHVPGFCRDGKGCRCEGLDTGEESVETETDYPTPEECDDDACLDKCMKDGNVKQAKCMESGACVCTFHKKEPPPECTKLQCEIACRRDDKELIDANCTERNTCMCYHKQDCKESICEELCDNSSKEVLESYCGENNKCYCVYGSARA